MKHRVRPAFLLALLTVASAGCDSNTPTIVDPSQSVFDLGEFVERSFANGVDVEIVGDVREPLFPNSNAVLLTVGGEFVEVYEFIGPGTAVVESQVVSEDGTTVRGTVIDWEATPHFYRNGRVVVVYIGDNPDTLFVLEFFLGEQFAGGTSPTPDTSTEEGDGDTGDEMEGA